MRFIIAKPENYMSFGDLFYEKPRLGENKRLFEQLYQMCREKADEAFPNYRHDTKQKKLMRIVANELEMIEATDAAFAVLIMKEIADLSHEMGYPTELLASESGLVISWLLGITSINPCQFSDFAIPSEMFCEEAFDGFFKGSQHDGVSFTLAIAEPVREKIQQRLDQRFSHIATLNHTYASISLPDYGLLEKIGNYAKETGIAKIMKEQRRKNRNRNKKVFTKPKIRPGSQIWKAKHKRRMVESCLFWMQSIINMELPVKLIIYLQHHRFKNRLLMGSIRYISGMKCISHISSSSL